MRRNIDLVVSLTEGVAYQDANFVILQNPSVAEIKALKKSCKGREGLRAIVTPADLFVWDAYWMTHHDAERTLAVPKGTGVSLHLHAKAVDWDVDAYEGNWDSEGPMADRMRREHAMIVKHPTLNRLYGGEIHVRGTDYVAGPDRPFDMYDETGGGRGYSFFFDDEDNLR